MTNNNFNFYYKFLIKSFGHADCSGCRALAHVLADYEEGSKIKELYNNYAHRINSTPSAVERCVRLYLNCITRDYTIEELSVMLDYAFRPGQTTLKAAEFIPVLKFVLDQEKTEEA